jgi:putative transposase
VAKPSLTKTDRVPGPFLFLERAGYHRRSLITDPAFPTRYPHRVRPHLKRYYGNGDLHFITFSCYRRVPLLSAPEIRDRFLSVLEEVRQKYDFVVLGYVVMPEHVHLLISEPVVGNPSLAMQVLKQRTSRLTPHHERRFWQLRFYGFNVFSDSKRLEKLDYMHMNPVRRGLVVRPEEWRWSSYRYYALREKGPVAVDQGWKEIKWLQPR